MTTNNEQRTDLIVFLLARIEEEKACAKAEEVLRNGDPYYAPEGSEQSDFDRRITPARVLAECGAKWQIVLREQNRVKWHEDNGREWAYSFAVRDLATVYADHRDYREEWR